MQVNHLRGEILAELDGKKYCLVLTLQSLAELEKSFGDDTLESLVQRFSAGKFSSNDLIKIIAVGLRGAGYTYTDEEVSEMRVDGGANGYVAIVSQLLNATFNSENG
jgi:hypothetical protein